MSTNFNDTMLATVQKITELLPIPGADKIEMARVLGFSTVVRKGEFQVGDLGVWHNPDTVVDATNPVYAFMEKAKYRIKAIRLKGQVSQGLMLPLSAFQWPAPPVEGQDVSEHVKIQKYEAPMPESMRGQAKREGLPFGIPKTDEFNLLTWPGIWEEIRNVGHMTITLKIDGQSGTYYWHEFEPGVCSRNYDLLPNPNVGFWKIAEKYRIHEILARHNGRYVIQGECYGPGINGNRPGAKELSFAAFNVYDLTECRYLSPEAFHAFCVDNSIPFVPTLYVGSTDGWDLASLQAFANKQTYVNGSPAEGIVIRPAESAISQTSGRQLSGKIISEPFLLGTEIPA